MTILMTDLNNIHTQKYTIIWNLFIISSSSNLCNLNNIKKHSLLHFKQISLLNNKSTFIKQSIIPLDLKFIKNLYKTHFNVEELNETITRLIPIYNNNNIYYVGIFNYHTQQTNNQSIQQNTSNNVTYNKTLFIQLNNCIKHKKANFIKGVLKCDMNQYYLKDDAIILDTNENTKIKLKLLLTNIENYFWLFNWIIC